MAKQTLQDAFAEALLKQGFRETTADERSKKYRTFRRGEHEHAFFLGKAGAVRYGATASSSYSAPTSVRNAILGGVLPASWAAWWRAHAPLKERGLR